MGVNPVIARLKSGELVPVSVDGKRGSLKAKSWHGLWFYGLVPEGKSRPYDGFRLLGPDVLEDWISRMEIL